ncbi:MAG TPA: hypothetical protein VKQ28_04295 [Candidatus Acidoferrum sp.]|nr:hypothetical protein [Candidatus Acidoferrum sp.]
MRISFAQFFLTTAQSQTQFVLEFLEVGQFVPNVGEFRLQAKADQRARLHPASAKTQEPPDFAQFETQTLYPPNERKRLELALAVLSKPSRRPGSPGQQRVAFIEANGVNAEPDLFGYDADLHGMAPILNLHPGA